VSLTNATHIIVETNDIRNTRLTT